MRVVIVNSFDKKGGAAIAAFRLHNALNKHEKVHCNMLVQEKSSDLETIQTTTQSKWKKWLNFYRFAKERLIFTFYEKDKSIRFAFSLANTGEDISRNPLIKKADIIHIHWVYFGFLSLKSLKKLFALNKPIVWTFHDMWGFTGGCHYAGDCRNFRTECHDCPFLKKPGKNDLSNRIFYKKKNIYKKANLSIVTCSAWLKEQVKSSALLKEFNVQNIPNPIDLQNTFVKKNKTEARRRLGLNLEKKLILFGAMNIADKRKGFTFFGQALQILLSQKRDDFELVIYGKSSQEMLSKIPFKVNNVGMINSASKMVDVYNASDMFVIPSLEDNLPNTIVEAHACGLPVVGFATCGVNEMIVHKENGYLANYLSADSLAEGIRFILETNDYETLSNNSRRFAEQNYAEKKVSEQYYNLYSTLLEKSNQ